MDFIFEDLTADLSFVNCGHLCVLPTIPMVHESFVKYGDTKAVMAWGSITSAEGKIKEAYESQKMYDTILNALQRYF